MFSKNYSIYLERRGIVANRPPASTHPRIHATTAYDIVIKILDVGGVIKRSDNS